jgi:hypothetical protein
MNSIRGAVSAILSNLNSMWGIGGINRKIRFIVTPYLLVKTMIFFKGFRAVATYRFKNYAYLAKNEHVLQLLKLIDSLINGIENSSQGGNWVWPVDSSCIMYRFW